MQEEEKWLIARIALDAIGEKYDYVLAGSMALRAHGLASRPVDDIDLFNQPDIGSNAITAREEVIVALTDAGYTVKVENVWCLEQAADLTVSDPARSEDEPVTIQMVPMQMDYVPVDIDGIPVIAVQDSIHLKAEAVAWRTAAKDYIDLAEMNAVLGPEMVDTHIQSMHDPLDEVTFRSQLAHVAEIPDEHFAQYGVDAYQAAEVRQHILAWASELAQASPDPFAVEASGPASGVRALSPEQAEAAADRITEHSPESLLSDHELMVEAAKSRSLAEAAKGVAAEAEREATWRRVTFEASGGGPLAQALRDMGTAPEIVERAINSEREDIERVQEQAGELRRQANALGVLANYAQHEVARRQNLSPEERAAETTIRRGINGQVAARQEPTRAAVTARATAPTPHQQYSARA